MVRPNRVVLLALLCCSLLSAQAQYKQCLLGRVDSSSYYAIHLSPQIIGASGDNLQDIRIVNDKGVEVPYYIAPSYAQYDYQNFEPYKYTQREQNRQTELVVEVGEGAISSFDIQLKNAQLDKQATLSGSNDKRQWYALRDRINIAQSGSGGETSRIFTVNFPLSDYKYYRLAINDSLSAPLFVMGVGRQSQYSSCSHRRVGVVPQVKVWTKERQTHIVLAYGARYSLTQVELYVSRPQYFSRMLTLSTGDRYKISNQGQPITLSVDTRVDTLGLVVDNADDQPLVVDSIKTYISGQVLVAPLEKGRSYSLVFGNEAMVAPVYDLSFVRHLPQLDSMPAIVCDGLVVSEIATVDKQSVEPDSTWRVWQLVLLWGVIILVIGQIVYIVVRVVRRVR